MIPYQDYLRILPELIFTAFGILIMVLEPALPEYGSRKTSGLIAFAGCCAALAASFLQGGWQGEAFFGMVRVDAFSIFFHALIAIIAGLVVLASLDYLDAQQIHAGEYYALILFGSAGMALMSSAVELVLIFIALEISSISTYVLAGFRRRVAISAEASIKYFLLGSFATAFFLYGVALVFGSTGTTYTDAIAAAMPGNGEPLIYVAVALMFVGIGFKVAAAPFHIWTPDVYQGSPAPVVALMSTGPKAAAFAVLLRVLFGAGLPGWFWVAWILAALSMTIGNLAALVQTNVKRLLAYSSIAHAGYLLVAFCAASSGIGAAIFYTAAYAAMNVGAFAIVSHFGSVGERYVTVEDYAGLGRKQPLLAACFTLLLLSLIGIPVTGGFFAKFYVFSAALNANLLGLTLIGVINSAIAAYYYLRIIVVMYMRDDDRAHSPAAPVPLSLAVALVISIGLTIYLGVQPNAVLNAAGQGASALVHPAPPTRASLR
ncbi:MAG: NADH-quinone oxidoreductase subunit N [Acidobacteria bacterium]|nr:NADH-quinone oxidoreductase subunit N [Acidobacteriota bacterium]